MTFGCGDLESALLEGSPAQMSALEKHAAGCASCARELREWRQLSALAPGLRKEWSAPTLWPRIQQALASERRGLARWLRWVPAGGGGGEWWRGRGLVPVAALALSLVVSGTGLWLLQRGPGEGSAADWQTTADPLLTEQAVDQVELTERQYVAAIERLSALVRPRVASPTSPLVRSYREKLELLDTTISELQAGIDGNRLNSHLRRELMAIYREKQETLRDLMQITGPVDRSGERPANEGGL